MSRPQRFCRPACGGISLAAPLLLCSSICGLSQTAGSGAVRPMNLVESRYEIRAGEPAPLVAPAETLDFLLSAKTRQVSIAGGDAGGLVVAPSVHGDQILVAPSLRAEPGEYAVTLTATSETGDERQATMDVVVKPRVTVPNGATRAPVVLLNGWQTGFYNSCPVSTSSSDTFGNLAQYLVSDGVPVVYLFDNCAEDPNQSIETLASDLGAFLKTIKYDSGAQVPQIDLVAFSLGGLIARAYLAGLQTDQSYQPPAAALVHNLVLIASPNFGSFVTANYVYSITAGSQSAELVPGSSFLWNLVTWNQRGDDLRGINAIAVVGDAGTYLPNLSYGTQYPNASDGLVSVTSASAGFAVPAASTRVVPYCHIDPGVYSNPLFGSFQCSAAGIADVSSTSHLTGQIVRSFLAGTTSWSTIGTAASSDPYLDTDGGVFFGMVNAAGGYVSDMSSVVWGTVTLQNGGDTGTIFFGDLISGTGTYVAASKSLGSINCGSIAQVVGFSWATRCKIGPAITSVTPLASVSGRIVTAGTTLTINGRNLGTQCGGCLVQATPAGSSTAQTLTVTSWTNTAISFKLPASLTGFSTIKVVAISGADSIGIMAEAATATIAVDQASLAFAYTLGGAAPAAQSIQITNSGTGTLSFAAKASDAWLSVSSASGTAPATLSVSVSPSGLSAGTYTSSVEISSTSASNSPLSVTVTLTVTAASASVAVSPETLSFQAAAGGAAPAAQSLSITNAGSGTLSWSASADSFWIGLSPTSGSTPGTLSVSVNPANLAAGNYTGNVTVTPSDASVSPASIVVTLTVSGTPPAGNITGVTNAGSYQPAISSGAWVSIFGTNLSQGTYTWQSTDFVNGALPTTLEGVSVAINGVPAYVEYISPTQINVLAPDDSTTGAVQVQVTTAGQASNTATVQKNAFAPAFLTLDGNHVAAEHADYSLVGAPNLLPGAVTTPAKPGETILLYGVGFGPSNPAQPSGQLVTAAAPLANTVQVSIGGAAATVTFSGLVASGLYQFNVTVPNVPNGDAALAAAIGGVTTQTGVSVTVQQ